MQGLTEDILKQAIEVASPSEKLILLEHLEELERRKNRDAAQLQFMPFVCHIWPDFINGAHHQRMAKLFEDVANGKKKRVIINMAPRHAVITSTKIPTTTGFKLLADLRVGDYVFGPDGLPTQVIGKSDVFKDRALYRVTTDDGFSINVDGEHLWTVRLTRKHNVYHDYTTEQLWQRQNGVHLRTKRGGGVEILANKFVSNPRLPRLPDCAPVEYAEKELLIDPYVLGLWLGDGSKNSAIITSHDNDQALIRPEIERRGYQTTDQATKFSFGILKLKTQLNELNLIGNKHIPDSYLEGSVAQRRDLLKGLMDSDGNISKKGQCFFSQKSLAFIAQVRVLLASLGIKNSIQVSEAKIGNKSYGDTYRISFYANNIAFLPRKESRTLKNERTFGRYIKIEKLETVGDTQCIKVAREDGLFLAGEGYICTHNTKSEFASYLLPAWFLGKFPKKKIMQVSNTAELAEGFGRKVRNLVGSDEYREIFPEVGLRQDSKAAGRWNTNQGGEYFACITESTQLLTTRGWIRADEVTTADSLRTIKGWESVEQIHHTQHDEVISIGGVNAFSHNHPIWTMNRGWVNAGEIISSDMLAVESIFDIMKAHIFRLGAFTYGSYLGYTPISSLVWHKSALRESEEREIPFIRCSWNLFMSTMANIRQFLFGHGRPANSSAYYRPDRCQWAVFSRELQVGYPNGAGEQQARKYSYSWQNYGGTCSNTEHSARNYTVSDESRYDTRRGYNVSEKTETELQMYRDPENLGWLRNTAFRLINASSKPYERTPCVKRNTSRIVRTAQIVQGFLLGIRPATSISRKPANGEGFINFTLSGSNTFVVGGILTHNCGVGSALAGRGADIAIIDDPHTENEALAAQFNPAIYDKVYEWYTSGPRQRLQPGGSIIIVMTRWSARDLSGQIIDSSIDRTGADQWEVIEFPAILPSGKPLWPEFWSLQELEAVRAELPNSKWQAQYQQQPTSEQSAIIKREWWQMWEADRPPPVDYIIMAMDTAFEAKNSADYSAAVVFGVWYNPEDNDQPNLILLDMWRDKLEFPDLKAKTLELYKEWEPDALIIEKKASGAPLIAEIRKMGVPVQDYTPVRGTANNPNSKPIRLHAVSDVFASGKVWAPANTRWAEVLIDEVAAFPAGKNDDLVDCVSMAVNRYRQGGFIGTNLDEPEEQQYFRRKGAYY